MNWNSSWKELRQQLDGVQLSPKTAVLLDILEEEACKPPRINAWTLVVSGVGANSYASRYLCEQAHETNKTQGIRARIRVDLVFDFMLYERISTPPAASTPVGACTHQ